MIAAAFTLMVLFTLAGLLYPILVRGGGAIPVFVSAPSSHKSAARCAGCGRPFGEDEAFCPRCGRPQKSVCERCGRVLAGDELFCPGCGARICSGESEIEE